MQIAQLLPLAGGGIPIVIGITFLIQRGFKESSQRYFFMSLICLGLFGFLEGIAYFSNNQDIAWLLILLSKYSAVSGLYMVYGFALALRGNEEALKTIKPLFTGWVIIAPFFTIEGIVRTDWGWAVALNRPVLLFTFLWVFYFLLLAANEMSGLINEMKESENPFKWNLQWIRAGFLIWAILAVGTSAVVNMMTVQTYRPVFSVLQIFPTLMVTYGYLRTSIKGKQQQ